MISRRIIYTSKLNGISFNKSAHKQNSLNQQSSTETPKPCVWIRQTADNQFSSASSNTIKTPDLFSSPRYPSSSSTFTALTISINLLYDAVWMALNWVHSNPIVHIDVKTLGLIETLVFYLCVQIKIQVENEWTRFENVNLLHMPPLLLFGRIKWKEGRVERKKNSEAWRDNVSWPKTHSI